MSVSWDAPLPGGWARSFRLGEWLSDPVTPLFESWLLTQMENVMHGEYERYVGQRAPRPLHVIVNGWYFYSLNFLPASPKAIAGWLPGLAPRLLRSPRRVAAMFPPLAHLGVPLFVREWREELLPRYRVECERAEREVTTLPVGELPALIDRLATLAGCYFTSITFVAGSGWKTELPLAAFYRDRLSPKVGGSHLVLLQGLRPPDTASHAVRTLDWSQPTLGEAHGGAPDPDARARFARLAADREALEGRCQDALADDPRGLARFDRLLAAAQDASRLREEQLVPFTRPWPIFRRAIDRIGEELVRREAIDRIDDVHFLDVDELRTALRTEGRPQVRSGDVRARRAAWMRQRELVPPLVLGTLPPMLAAMLARADEAIRAPAPPADGVLARGTPASAGVAKGRVRVLRSPDDADRLAAGDVLVCRATTPAWTPLFARAAAIVTDVGSIASHASIVAREYGIPAVVGTGDATAKLEDGLVVIVDGAAGVVRRA